MREIDEYTPPDHDEPSCSRSLNNIWLLLKAIQFCSVHETYLQCERALLMDGPIRLWWDAIMRSWTIINSADFGQHPPWSTPIRADEPANSSGWLARIIVWLRTVNNVEIPIFLLPSYLSSET